MRRITPAGVRTVSLPATPPPARSNDRRLFAPARVLVDGITIESGCLRCPDTPCVKFGQDELNAPVVIPTPIAPDASVCPTGAIRADPAGTPTVDPERCIGCGLCAVRCPVAAIHLDPRSGVAVVAPAQGDSYVPTPYDPVAFPIDRATLGASFVEEAPPFEDADQVATQLLRLDRAMMSAADAQGVFRLLARNTFLSIGLPARLKNVGDNNAFGELAVGDAGRVLVIEVESRGDVLDALRRVLAGVAVVRSRYGLDPGAVVPCVVVRRLPNERVDYYRVLSDAAARIGVEVRTLPIGLLLLGIRSHDRALLDMINEQGILDEEQPSLGDAARDRWGPIASAHRLGLAPDK